MKLTDAQRAALDAWNAKARDLPRDDPEAYIRLTEAVYRAGAEAMREAVICAIKAHAAWNAVERYVTVIRALPLPGDTDE